MHSVFGAAPAPDRVPPVPEAAGAGRPVSFGVLLRRQRLAAGLTQEELASEAGLSVRAVADMERGRTARPYRRSVVRLADALALPARDRAGFVGAARTRWPSPGVQGVAGVPPGSSVAGTAALQLPVTPWQLPADVRHFVGRDAECAALTSWLDTSASTDSAKIVTIVGVAGVGKTGLALRWGHRSMERFPHGQLYADLRGYDPDQGPIPAGIVLDRFLRALGLSGEQVPDGLEDRAALVRSLLHDRRMLIVLDDARTAAQVRPVLPGSGSCFVLVTSRNRLDDLISYDGAQLLALNPLTSDEACELVSRMAGERRLDLQSAQQVAVRCDRLPLALRIAGARLAVRPYESGPDLAGRLADEERRLQELSHPPGGVRLSLALSYRTLPVRPARLFRLLGLVSMGDFAAWTAAALLDEPEDRAEGLLDDLVRAGLLETTGVDCAGQLRYRQHDLMRLYARERCMAEDSPEVREESVQRLLGAALQLSIEADRSFGMPFIYPMHGNSPGYKAEDGTLSRVRDQPMSWFEAERSLLTSAVMHASRSGMAHYAWELTSAQCQFFSARRHMDAWRQCIDHAQAAAKAAGDQRGEAAMLLQQADLLIETSQPEKAAPIVQQALAMVTRRGDADAQAVCWTLLAALDWELGQPARAKLDVQQALRLLTSSTPQPVRDHALMALGLTHLGEGTYADAAECFRRYLRSQQEAGNIRGQAEACHLLGLVRLRQGQHATSARLLARAMRTAEQSGNKRTRMAAQIRLGQVLIETGELERAQPLLDDAVFKVTPQRSPRYRAIALEALAELHAALGRPEQQELLIAEAQALWNKLPSGAPR